MASIKWSYFFKIDASLAHGARSDLTHLTVNAAELKIRRRGKSQATGSQLRPGASRNVKSSGQGRRGQLKSGEAERLKV